MHAGFSTSTPILWPKIVTTAGDAAPPQPHAPTHDSDGSDPMFAGDIGAIATSEKGAVNGVAALDSNGKIPSSQLPDISITHYLGAVNSQAEMLALSGDLGDWCIRDDSGTVWIITGADPTLLASWTQMAYPPAPVSSVAGMIGDVILSNDDVGLGNVLNVEQAPAARHIYAGVGLTGGGNLTADRTLSAVFGTADNTICQGNDVRLSDARTPTAHTHPISDVTNLQTTLDGKALTVHSHVIGDVTGLQTALDGKASTSHTHVISDVTGLQTALDGKAATAHTHAIGDVTGLQTALDGKASSSHTHAIADVTGLQTALDGKAASSHTHTISDVSNLRTELDGKADISHTHSISDVTNLQISLDGKVNTATSVFAGTGLTGGGALFTSRTLSANFGTATGTVCQGDDTRLSDARTPLAHTHPQSDIVNLVSDLSNKVPTSRAITTGTGLSGGGDLTANRTLSVTYGTTAGTSCQGNDTRLSDPRTPLAHTHPISEVTNLQTSLDGKVPTSRTISTGTGLSGGGNLTANRTLSATSQQIADAYTMTVANLVVGQYYWLDMNCPAARDLTVLTAICDAGTVTLQFLKNFGSLGMLTVVVDPGGNQVTWTGQDLTAGNTFIVQPTAVTGGATSFTVQLNYTQLATVL
jgi:hypothetical protein